MGGCAREGERSAGLLVSRKFNSLTWIHTCMLSPNLFADFKAKNLSLFANMGKGPIKKF